MPRYAGVLLDLFGTLVLAEPERLPVLRIGATSVRTTVGALGTLLAAYAPGVSAEAFWHALAGVSEEMNQRRLREHVEEPSRERFRRALARVGCDAEACREGGAALARAHHRALADVIVLPAGARGAARRAARAPPSWRSSATSTTPRRAFEILAAPRRPRRGSTRSSCRSRSGCGSRIPLMVETRAPRARRRAGRGAHGRRHLRRGRRGGARRRRRRRVDRSRGARACRPAPCRRASSFAVAARARSGAGLSARAPDALQTRRGDGAPVDAALEALAQQRDGVDPERRAAGPSRCRAAADASGRVAIDLERRDQEVDRQVVRQHARCVRRGSAAGGRW